MKKVYLDNAATTSVDPSVFAAMKPYFSVKYGNASEPHIWGQEARQVVEKSRETIANFLNAKPSEIYFTGCATESINLAHKGLLEAKLREFSNSNPSTSSGQVFQFSKKKPHIITTSIEHKAVLETCNHLEKAGMATVTYLPVDHFGLIDLKQLEKKIRPETVLVSVMYVNNEVGTVEPIEEVGQLIKKINESRIAKKESRIYFHTDATQAMQYFDCDVNKLNVDLLSFTGHKFYAPKGIGALYLRTGTPLVRQIDGGGQEKRLRAGTENVPYIVALAKALELVSSKFKVQSSKLIESRDFLIKEMLKIKDVELTGHPEKRAPHIASFVVKGVEGEAMLLMLSDKGIAAASGSACTSGVLSPSHVLLAMGIAPEVAHGSMRFSLGKDTTKEDIDYVIKTFPSIVERLRLMAPKL